jgi:hypothetical protein
VVNGLYKLTPLYPVDENTFNLTINPNEILNYNEATGLIILK